MASGSSTPGNFTGSPATPVSSAPRTNSSAVPRPSPDRPTDTSNPQQQPPTVQSLYGGMKPEIVMAIVLGACFGGVLLVLGCLFVYTRCVRPRLIERAKLRKAAAAKDSDGSTSV
ncbi:hypothetical protein PtA15_1A108 [Puccinia triticina]|uniref:Uncharacterized protein n=1 Tax=Puccinia triticina TaxID=208348 RepID=A0ABY7C6L0_9BASI|nr:uncharacterized protein PtA15_1A108 [Puccinia triticina]WAQ80770.1 hypothetical protein PtA15_1A108 [Puccinia triticina]WAR51660.1 hypothetical protein PtB15_1B96 [Puccinia triticina]